MHETFSRRKGWWNGSEAFQVIRPFRGGPPRQVAGLIKKRRKIHGSGQGGERAALGAAAQNSLTGSTHPSTRPGMNNFFL